MAETTNTPLVSVIMPAYNAAKYIAASVRSVQEQTYQNWELIIVDDGSKDDTASIVKQLASADARLRYIFQENGRQGKARNNGLRNAKGELICFLDADDLWVKEKLDVQVQVMLSERPDLTFSDYYRFHTLDQPELLNLPPGDFQGEEYFDHFLVSNRIGILTVMTWTNVLREAGGFNEQPPIQNAEDLHLWMKLFLSGLRFKALQQPLAYYRLQEASSSAGDRHVIIPALNAMKDVGILFPHYASNIKSALQRRLLDYFFYNNINNAGLLKQLLGVKDQLMSGGFSSGLLSRIYQLLGKRAFRMVFRLGILLFPVRPKEIKFKDLSV